MRWRWRRLDVVRLAFALGVGFATNTVHASEMTQNFAWGVLDKSYSILNDNTLSDVERREKFQAFLHAVTAFDRTALFTLGPFANTIEGSEIETFLESFKASLTSRVQLRLEALRDFTLSVSGSTDRAADDSIVMIDVISAESDGARDARAAFRVRENAEGDPVIIDIQFEGIWLGIVAREVNMSYLAHNDGNLSELSNFLDEQRRASVLSSFLEEQSQNPEAEDRITN